MILLQQIASITVPKILIVVMKDNYKEFNICGNICVEFQSPE